MLTKQGLLDTLLGEVNRQLSAKGLYIKTGEVGIVDATVIEAKQSRPRKNAKGENTQDSEAGYNVKVAANEEDQHLRVGACQRRRLRQGHRLYPRQRTRLPFLEKTADPAPNTSCIPTRPMPARNMTGYWPMDAKRRTIAKGL